MTLESVLEQFKPYSSLKTAVFFLGIRNYCTLVDTPANHGFDDIYSDLFCTVINGKLETFVGSTNPGQYYIQHPVNPSGCAQLVPGLWHFSFGYHKGYKALVQAEEFTVNRLDLKGNVIKKEKGEFGIHCHSGGAEYLIGKYSAGCQIIKSPEGPWQKTWLSFFEPLEGACKAANQSTVPYLLVDSLKTSTVEV